MRSKIQGNISGELPFEVSRRLIATTEDVIVLSDPLPSTSFGRVWGWARGLVEPLLLVFTGASRMSNSAVTAAVLIVFIPLIAWALQTLSLISLEKAKTYVGAFWILLAIVITYSKPSRYALTGYKARKVSQILDRMPELHSRGTELFPAVQSCLLRAEDDTKARATTIKWVAGSAFAVALLLGQKGLELNDGNMLSYALISVAAALIIAGFIAVHTRGTVAVYGLAHAVIHKLEAQASIRQSSQALRKRRRINAP